MKYTLWKFSVSLKLSTYIRTKQKSIEWLNTYRARWHLYNFKLRLKN
ncbi:hypothetical protein VCRA2123O444_20024 [Vibrio crassostreae]|nr:hypothetical protein VCRA2118O429_10408 [Vibrio crassostreae]CAK1963663.1 hypothetical protein VCRA2114O422_20024 [Vibrio crassostreae]CAK1968911.1 hypothetical protein VCRA2119O431_20024 [Vibrio crassostreae]CAK1986716.1 hypothetical protein VCRA2114O421_20188 [Vibrio crassostreae]CAK1986802.1 hypothetical protein VCRA2119O432_20188 [Vibrio crassostreae]